jgi:hypothetical protein
VPTDWDVEAAALYDFVLDADAGRVEATPYL